MQRRVATVAITIVMLLSTRASAQPAAVDGIARLLASLERVVQSGSPADFEALLTRSANRTRARDFIAAELAPGTTRVTIHERDRGVLSGVARRLLLEVFIESGPHARIATWRLDVRRPSADADDGWAIEDEERLGGVETLYRLSLDGARQFDARDLTISAEDLDITLPRGSAFLVPTDQGVTGVVLLGRGTMKFHPAPETEQGQVKIFCGAKILAAEFDAAFLRLNPADYAQIVDAQQLVERPMDPAALRRADEVFREESPKSFSLDLADLSRDSWWMLPQPGDLLAEVRTRRFGTLTYARSTSDPEDISVFDRKRRRNIAVYASREALERRGPFYDEDDLLDYDVLDYDVDVAIAPERSWIDGFARMRLRIRSASASALTIRLADPLVVRSVNSLEYGRMLAIRVRDQNSIVVNLPTAMPHDAQLNLAIAYSGRLEPQPPDSEAAGGQLGQVAVPDDEGLYAPEASYIYSNRSYWYPQSTVTDYATAILRITIPATYDCIASGELYPGAPAVLPATATEPARKFYVFTVARPARYMGLVISRFAVTSTATLVLSDLIRRGGELTGVAPLESLRIAVAANRRVEPRTRNAIDRTLDIVRFYTSILGDLPYPSLTAAIIERDLPGGHSPPYFAVLNQPNGSTPASAWRNDPASFPNFPEFFLAHEIAHQWWGQAVGWRNYHEQWLSEAFAQYFAALYAEHHGGADVFGGVLRQFRRWSFEHSDQGPIYLGYRLGHIKGNSRVFRAIVYDKGAAVLHMLRRLLGDDAFFRGVRRFYRESRFKKASTEDLRAALEAESGRNLERFFGEWVYGSTLPRLKFSYRTEAGDNGRDVVLRVEQIGRLFDVPVTVTLQYADAKPVDVVVAVTERTAELRVPLAGRLRGVDVKMDEILADVSR